MKSLCGSIVALITPFNKGRLDLPAFERLIHWHVSQGTHGILVGGSTGEGALLSLEEQRCLIESASRILKGRIPLMANATHMTTDGAIQLARQAESFGVDALLIASPPYIKPTQNALYDHFQSICAACATPIVLYNHPGRTGVELSEQLIESLSKIKNIIGLKETSTDLKRVKDLRSKLPEPFLLFCGDDPLNADYLRLGANGCISVTANIAPKEMSSFYKAWEQKDDGAFNASLQQLTPIHSVMGIEGNPVSVKGALALMRLCSDEMRAPLKSLSSQGSETMRPILEAASLLNSPIQQEEIRHGS